MSGGVFRVSMTLVLGLMLSAFVGWAAWFEIDQTVRAQGQVIASSRTQIIQVVDGGVLSRLDVQEGDLVQEGQLLAVLEDERARAGYEEVMGRMIDLEASLVRLHAEVERREPVFDERFARYPQLVAAQLGLFTQRLRSLNEQLAVQQDSLSLLRDELAAKERLFATGDISSMEILRSRQQLAEVQGRIVDVRNRYLQESRLEISKVEGELASAREKLAERKSVLEKLEIRAPISGLVKFLRVTTMGGVLRPGDELMQIAPAEGGVVLEAKVLPAEIAQLSSGLPVSIKLDPYDYSIYGALDGTVTYISPDTLTEQGNNGAPFSYYRVHVMIHDEQANPRAERMNILLGMTGSVDIRLGKRSVLAYLMKPIIKTFGSAMNER